jgi:hypothetical protein
MSDSNLPSSPSSSTPSSPSELVELRELCAELRWQTHTLRIALLIVASALSAFFWLEVRRSNQTLTLLRPQVAQIMEANKVQDPLANRFIGQLVEFAKTHPDFAAILKKYPIQASVAGSTNASVPAVPAK